MFKSVFTWRSEGSFSSVQPRLAPPATQQLTHHQILSISSHAFRLRIPHFLWRPEIAPEFPLFLFIHDSGSFRAGLTMHMPPDDGSIAARALRRSKHPLDGPLVPRATHHPRTVGSFSSVLEIME
jgi:hypothetical protein